MNSAVMRKQGCAPGYFDRLHYNRLIISVLSSDIQPENSQITSFSDMRQEATHPLILSMALMALATVLSFIQFKAPGGGQAYEVHVFQKLETMIN